MKSMRIVSLLIVSLLITTGSVFAKSYYLASEAPCGSEVVVVERSYFPCKEVSYYHPCLDRIACINEDTLITRAKANALGCKIARYEISPVCCPRPRCYPSTICRPVRVNCSRPCSSVVKLVKTDPCFKRKVDREFIKLNSEIELLKRRVMFLEIEAY